MHGTTQMTDAGFSSVFVQSSDGLRLHARDYATRDGIAVPVVCLPGLARTAADFHELALHLSRHARTTRRVLAIDYRGRGLSDRDSDWRHYDPQVELADTLTMLAACGITSAAVVGTSRGGLIAMGLAMLQPTLVKAAVLNDIGPVIDIAGLLRIKGYVGGLAQPEDFAEAVAILKALFEAQFPALPEASWLRMAERTWRRQTAQEAEGAAPMLVTDYDPALLNTLEALDPKAPLPPLWPLFDALAQRPVLALRGANSDVLSAATLAEMAARSPNVEVHTIAGQGHAPLLFELEQHELIERFLEKLD